MTARRCPLHTHTQYSTDYLSTMTSTNVPVAGVQTQLFIDMTTTTARFLSAIVTLNDQRQTDG